jgi:hypothetical protein
MLKKITGPVATVVTGIFTGTAGMYASYKTNEKNKEMQDQTLEYQKEMQDQTHKNRLEEIAFQHELEMKKMKSTYNTHYSNQVESNENTVGPVTQMLQDSNSSKKFTELSNIVDSTSYNISSISEKTLFPTDPLNLIALSYFLFNVAILWCVIGLTINYYIKLYGDQYLDNIPKWLLPFVKVYLKYTLFNSKLLLIILLISIFSSMLLSIALYLI